MPAKSESQKRLFCMAYAVRKGKLERNKVSKEVLDIADGDMTDKEIKDFMTTESDKFRSVLSYIYESAYITPYADKEDGIEFKDPIELFMVIKPGFENLSELIINKLEENDFKVVKTRPKQLLEKEAKTLYKVHKDEDFFEDLVKYMSSGISVGLILKPKRNFKNPFKTLEKVKDEIRKEWGESDMRNVVHSSDNLENMKEESSVYF